LYPKEKQKKMYKKALILYEKGVQYSAPTSEFRWRDLSRKIEKQD
jgi:hypothetical protein